MKRYFTRWQYSLPLLGFLLLLLLFMQGLRLDPRRLPSALLNKPMPLFTLPALQPQQPPVMSQHWLGQVALVHVWASWCITCREEQPLLMDLARTQAVTIYGLDYKDQRDAALQWLQMAGNPYQAIAYDATGRVAIDWGVYGTPETFLIDQHGIIRYKQIGPLTQEVWQQRLLPLIKQLYASD